MTVTYQRGTVTIDGDFARFGSKSYAIDKINTVDVRLKEASHAVEVFLFLIAGLCLLVGVVNSSAGWFVAGLIAGVLGYFAHQSAKDEYLLFLVTSSSQAQAFQSTDREEVIALRTAVENAMVQQRQR